MPSWHHLENSIHLLSPKKRHKENSVQGIPPTMPAPSPQAHSGAVSSGKTGSFCPHLATVHYEKCRRDAGFAGSELVSTGNFQACSLPAQEDPKPKPWNRTSQIQCPSKPSLLCCGHLVTTVAWTETANLIHISHQILTTYITFRWLKLGETSGMTVNSTTLWPSKNLIALWSLWNTYCTNKKQGLAVWSFESC